ncbi:MAG: hypothetical protein A3K04_02325 [Gallionellales bacterium RBG_16_56_9]|nr:MAG: hypothetical protein A3K04_02325 [Gallionellales bacterium RBG_16_56_9]
MAREYKHIYIFVNKYICLTGYKYDNSVLSMKYGERLKAARTYADLTQGELADKIGNIVTQANISYLENSDAVGSECTVQFAMACVVNPVWLATGNGAMIDRYAISDELISRAIKLMEPLPEYAKQHVVKEIADTAELVKKAAATDHKRDTA